MLLEILTVTLSLLICFFLFFIYLLKTKLYIQNNNTVYENDKIIEHNTLNKLANQLKELIKEVTINNTEINTKFLVNMMVKKGYFHCLCIESFQFMLFELMNTKNTDVLVSLFVRGVNDTSSIIVKMPPELIYQQDIQHSLDTYLTNEHINFSNHGLSSMFLILFMQNTPFLKEINLEKEENLVIKKYNLFNYFFYKICLFKNEEYLFLKLHELEGKEDYKVAFVIYNKFTN
ncbi:hypothetical protein TUBRATIS_30910 [Tubulinosema ratisbonensis]|uniref:Uncharacterized protein n=1 Tax=Tubulinosema ratisbonensis TaxID=291195 RepID=A0A437AH36_9MICR|nr:hypothetical protein TUBRATIS_30910 [Tubulinosema ratisbonensis]